MRIGNADSVSYCPAGLPPGSLRSQDDNKTGEQAGQVKAKRGGSVAFHFPMSPANVPCPLPMRMRMRTHAAHAVVGAVSVLCHSATPSPDCRAPVPGPYGAGPRHLCTHRAPVLRYERNCTVRTAGMEVGLEGSKSIFIDQIEPHLQAERPSGRVLS